MLSLPFSCSVLTMAARPNDAFSASDEPSSFMVGLVFFLVAVLIGLALYTLFAFGEEKANDKTVVDRALPSLINVVHYSPEEARRILDPQWKDLQSVSPLTLSATAGGTSVHWQRVGSDGCDIMKRFFAQYPDKAAHLQIVQNGVALDPGAYGDMPCWTRDKYDDFSFEFRPR
jgi:hypothetical protein